MRDPALFDRPGPFDEPGLFDETGSVDDPAELAPAAVVAVATPPAPAPGVDAAATVATVLVATDGSCLANPGGATGWAYVRNDGAWASGGCPSGTNQIGELQAVVLALADHPDVALEIQCDSSYAIGCATTWKPGWQRNKYINSQRKTVSNLAIIQQLHALLDARKLPVIFTKVKGHDLANRWPLNTAVDVICGRAALATRTAGAPVFDSGVMDIDWETRG